MKLTTLTHIALIILAPLSFPSVAAAVDLSATYQIVVGAGQTCLVTFTQTGTVLSLSGSCSTVGNVTATGTVDTGTGAFSATGQADNGCASPGSLALSGTGDGTTISGSVYCTAGSSFFGSTCGNDIIDAGEQCDDQNFHDGDCCSSTCQLDPNGSTCLDDGNACTSEACDGAGTCEHLPNVPAGEPCSPDSYDCTDSVCDGAGACVHPVSVAGTPCSSDYNLCTDDVCDAAGACEHTPVTEPQPCEDYNFCTTNDACDASGTCTGEVLPLGTPCGENDCSVSECDGNGFCAKTSDDCAPCGSCTCHFYCYCEYDTDECTASEHSKLKLVTRDPDTEDSARWSWTRGPAVAVTEFGDPLNSTNYALCVRGYDVGYETITMTEMPAGSGWTSTSRGFKYKDSTLTAVLGSGKAGKAKFKVRAKGPVLNLPASFSDYTGVRVQLRTLNQCWAGDFAASSLEVVEPDQIRAKYP